MTSLDDLEADARAVPADGWITVPAADVLAMIAELRAGEQRVADAYQIVGSLAHASGVFEHAEVTAALDFLAYQLESPLPWPKDMVGLQAAIRAAASAPPPAQDP